MAECIKCGVALAEGQAFCVECGAEAPRVPAYSSASSYQPPGSGYFSPNPVYTYPSAEKKKDKVLSSGAFLGSVIAMSLPVIGLIIQIIWACGAAKNLNRRNLSRAYLVLSLIGIILIAAGYYLLLPLIPDILSDYFLNNFKAFL